MSGNLLPLFLLGKERKVQELSIGVANRTIKGWKTGGEGKPLVIALHGWLDNAASFQPLAEFVSDFQLVAIDLPGHGLSDHRSSDAHYHLMDWVQDVHQVVEALTQKPVIIMGHSMGGIIASLYASCFPEKVSALVSIEAIGPLSESAQTSPQQLKKSVLSRIAIDNKTPRHPKTLEQAIQARLLAGGVSNHSAELLVKRNIRTKGEQLEWRSDRRLRTVSSLRMVPEQAEAFIRHITCPVLIITGSQGFEKIKTNLAIRQHWYSDLTQIELEGGHHLHMDHPESTWEAINGHLHKIFVNLR